MIQRSRACVLCDAPIDHSYDAGEGQRTCRDCGVTWSTLEEPSKPDAEWDNEYYGNPSLVRMHQARRSAMEALAERLVKVCPKPGRFLDVGAGVGILMKSMKDRGWEVEGVEPSARAAALARELTGGNVSVGLLESVKLPSERYDAVAVINTLAHVSEPQGFLTEVLRILRPGGMVMLRESHPTVVKLQRRLLRQIRKEIPQRARLVSEPGQRFSPRSLVFGLERAGFDRIRWEPSPLFEEAGKESRGAAVTYGRRMVGWGGDLLHRISAGRLAILPNFLIFGRAAVKASR